MYFVTARTFQARMLLTPSPAINQAIGGALARAVELTGVELHAFVVMSNHLHLLVSARGASLSKFMQSFLGNVSRKVGRAVRWSGSLWQRRFSAEHVLDDEAALGRLRYILSHGVKEGLVRHPADWPGLSCLHLLRDGGEERHLFFHWARRWKNGTLVEGGDNLWDARWAEEVALRLTPLPCWSDLSRQSQRQQVDLMVASITDGATHAHQNVPGADVIVRQSPHHRPARSKKSPKPLCHASTREARRAFRESLAAWCGAYALASARFRQGNWTVDFPRWAFRPSVPFSDSDNGEHYRPSQSV
jgi:REP element-mobilizing transposase RayT